MTKRKKTSKHRRRTKQEVLSKPAGLPIDKRLPIVAIPTTVDRSTAGAARASPTSFAYEVVDPRTGLFVVIHVDHTTLAKISAANALLHFGFVNPSLHDAPKSTWPHKWCYLSQQQCMELESTGLPVLSQEHILTESLQIDLCGQGLYFAHNIQQFFDSWIEIIWQEYVVEQELRRYQKLHKQKQSTVTIGQPGEANLQVAETWIPLENSAVRIRSMWDRLHRYIIPLYFSHNIAPDPTNKQYWIELDRTARQLLNQEQIPFYDLLFRSIRDTEDSPLKTVRDALIHKLSYRPVGVVPVDTFDALSLRITDDLHQLVLVERSRIREALVLMAAVIRAKKPANAEYTGLLSI